MEEGEVEIPSPSNGHHWLRWRNMICCRDCGIIRRADDQNKPCRGRVYVGPRIPPNITKARETDKC